MAPVRMPRVLTSVRHDDDRDGEELLRGEAELCPSRSDNSPPEMEGKNTPVYLAKATATAAMVPVWMTTNSRPAEEKAPEASEGFAEIDVLAAGVGHGGGEFAIAERGDDGEQRAPAASRRSAGRGISPGGRRRR